MLLRVATVVFLAAGAASAAPEENFKTPGSLTGIAKPTTVEVRSRAGRPYLRLEQVAQKGTARLLLFCSHGKFSLRGGIVTLPEVTRQRAEEAVRSYLELDWREVLPRRGRQGLLPDGNVLWLSRDVPARTLAALQRTDTLGLWVENHGIWRWGALMDLRAVQPKLRKFVRSCR